jgi:hypothetical protein
MIERESSVIKKFACDYDRRILTIYFKNGKTYDYFDVREGVFEDLKYTKSVGEYFNRWIKNNYDWSPHPKTRQKFEIGDKVKFVNFQISGIIKNIENHEFKGKSRKVYWIDMGTDVLVRGFSYQLEKV